MTASQVPAKGYVTGEQSEMFWNYCVPPHAGQKLQLLTVGGIATTGQWSGELGETFVGWAPLLKINHEEVARVIRERNLRVIARLSNDLRDLIGSPGSTDVEADAATIRVARAMYLARLPEAARIGSDLIRPGAVMRLEPTESYRSWRDKLVFERVITNPHEPLYSAAMMGAQFTFCEPLDLWLVLHVEDWPDQMINALKQLVNRGVPVSEGAGNTRFTFPEDDQVDESE